MVKRIRFFALVLLPICLFGCSIWGHKSAESPPAAPLEAKVPDSPIQIRVADVSNDTPQVYDVDAIGLLWNGVEKSLSQRGMLWKPGSGGSPYVMDCRIVYFKEPNLGKRLLPHWGNTVLTVRVNISRCGKCVATFETSRTIGYGKGMWTLHAWKEVFALMSNDVVKQAVEKL
jgi:hypothetical protein